MGGENNYLYNPSYKDENYAFQFKIPWHANTAKGLAVAIPTTLILLLLLNLIRDPQPEARQLITNTVPLELLSFGYGDGTGMSKGNLSREGVAHKGALPQSELHDAEIAAKTRISKVAATTDITESSNIVARREISSTEKTTSNEIGSSARNIGSPDGEDWGTGLGTRGTGPGKGEGFGDIEWGGGGNRVVLVKKIPTFPPGVNTSAQIKIRFTVRPDGTVGSIVPLQKADPRLERAAIEALRQWRFNPIKEDIEMVGIIPFTFRLR